MMIHKIVQKKPEDNTHERVVEWGLEIDEDGSLFLAATIGKLRQDVVEIDKDGQLRLPKTYWDDGDRILKVDDDGRLDVKRE